MGQRGEVYSERITSSNGKRTYFFNVKQNKNGNFFLEIVESKHSANSTGFDRHQIIIFKEDIDSFADIFQHVHEYVQNETDEVV